MRVKPVSRLLRDIDVFNVIGLAVGIAANPCEEWEPGPVRVHLYIPIFEEAG
jgi:hypothetical protein